MRSLTLLSASASQLPSSSTSESSSLARRITAITTDPATNTLYSASEELNKSGEVLLHLWSLEQRARGLHSVSSHLAHTSHYLVDDILRSLRSPRQSSPGPPKLQLDPSRAIRRRTRSSRSNICPSLTLWSSYCAMVTLSRSSRPLASRAQPR